MDACGVAAARTGRLRHRAGLRDAVGARTRREEAPRALVPALASKAFVLRPQALWPHGGGEPLHPAIAFSSVCPLAVLLTEEAPGGFAVEARIPGATAVIRRVLRELPKMRLGAERSDLLTGKGA